LNNTDATGNDISGTGQASGKEKLSIR